MNLSDFVKNNRQVISFVNNWPDKDQPFHIKQNFIVGHIGVLDDSHKGQLNIIKIAQESMKSGFDIGFIMVGSGRDELILKNISKNLDNVYFTGQVENIGDYLNAFDVFIFPSKHEGLGSTLIDAISFGLPVIASDVGGIPEIIRHEENGYLIKPANITGYFSALKKLYLNKCLIEKMNKKNRLKSKDFTIEKMTSSYIGIYKNAM